MDKNKLCLLLALLSTMQCFASNNQSHQRTIQRQYTYPMTHGYALITEYNNGTRQIEQYSATFCVMVTFVEFKNSRIWEEYKMLANQWSSNPEERNIAQIYQCYDGDCS